MLDIGANIIEFRDANNLSQKDLDDLIHVSRQTISKWELNKSTPNLEYLL
ncbi:MAG: helix-turn-helix transcriptional regulator, partial [Coprobacillaceae bacterium]